MPILGLTERRRMPRGGFIRLGTMMTNAKGVEYPSKSDHFICDFEDPKATEAFRKVYGDEPKQIEIAFTSNDHEVIFPQHYKCYGSSTGLKCKGDGEYARRYVDGNYEAFKCPGEDPEGNFQNAPEFCEFASGQGKHNGCKQIANLQFFIRGIPGIQIFQCNTSSFNSIMNINAGIDLFKMARGNKSIAGVWINLVLVSQEAQADGRKVNIFVLKLDIPGTVEDIFSLDCAFEPAVGSLPEPDDSRDRLLLPVDGQEPDSQKQPSQPPTTSVPSSRSAGAQLDLVNDPDVDAAFRANNISGKRRFDALDVAREKGWSRETLLGQILRAGQRDRKHGAPDSSEPERQEKSMAPEADETVPEPDDASHEQASQEQHMKSIQDEQEPVPRTAIPRDVADAENF